MSGKRAKSFRKKYSLSKKALALCAGFFLSCTPLAAENEFLVSAFVPVTKPFGPVVEMKYGFGGGLRLTYRTAKVINIFAQGEYLSMAMPSGVNPITLWDASLGAGYHFILTDRSSIDLNAFGGIYSAQTTIDGDNRTVPGFTAGLSLGFSYRISPVVSADAILSGTHFASASQPLIMLNGELAPEVTFNITELFNKERKVDMTLDGLAPVFPALYSWYENNPFGQVTITNNEDTAITDVTVSFHQPQYMNHAKECVTIPKIEKGESAAVDLLAFFNEQMLELTEMTVTNSTVTVNYHCLGQKRTKTFTIDVPVYGRNNMSWDDDRRAAVFVSSKDPAAMRFAKQVASIVREKKEPTLPMNIQYAMGIFEALNQFGLNYVIDPTSAFADNVGTASIDFLQFPYQTLMFKGGDCDDISILVCSLFEAVGIRTAFITIPGHIFMAFDSGLTLDEGIETLNSLDNYIVIEDELWIPLEITLSNEGFYKAFKYGAREWNKAYAEDTAAIYRMQDSWTIYPPISVPGVASKFTMPSSKNISAAFEKSMELWKRGELREKRVITPAKFSYISQAAERTDRRGRADRADKIEVEESTNVLSENPFAVSTLYEVLALSGQEVDMHDITDIQLPQYNSDKKIEVAKSDSYSDFYDDEIEEEKTDDDFAIPVIAVNVPGPEELGIFVHGLAENTTSSQEPVQIAKNTEKAKTQVTVLSEKIIPSIPVPEQKEVKEVATIKNIETNETTSENLPVSVSTNINTSINTKTEADKGVETVKNTSNEPEKKRIPVLPIAAVAVTFVAGASIMIPKKKKK